MSELLAPVRARMDDFDVTTRMILERLDTNPEA